MIVVGLVKATDLTFSSEYICLLHFTKYTKNDKTLILEKVNSRNTFQIR